MSVHRRRPDRQGSSGQGAHRLSAVSHQIHSQEHRCGGFFSFSRYNLHNRGGGSANDLIGNYPLDLSGEALNGSWKLRVNDNYTYVTGYINSWSIEF